MTSQPSPDLGPFEPLAENLQRITEALAATTTQREVIEIVLTPAVQALGAVAGIILLVDETDQQLKIGGSQGYEDGALTLWQEGPIADHALISDILRMKEALYFEYAGALKEVYPQLESRTGVLEVVANAVLPMFLDDRPLGVIVLDFTEPHTFTPAERRFLTILSGQCAVALGRAEATRTLEARVDERTRQLEDQTRQLKEQTRQLEEERAAQEAFVAFTEAVGSQTDLYTLVQQAITVLQSRFPGTSIVYYEEEGDLWKGRIWSDDMNLELVAVITAGLPRETPLFAQVLQTRQPVFTDAWDAQREGVASSEEYGAAANYPLIVNGELHWLLSIGLRDTRTWSHADRALLRAVGRGLNLALERTEIGRQLTRQNTELQARTRALEAFAELTRDLALTTDPLLLIGRAQEVVMSMLSPGAALYYVPEGDHWSTRMQHGTLHSPELQAVVDAGLSYAETRNLVIPWTTGQPHYQDDYDQDTDHLPALVKHISATATLPLRVEGELTGILAFVLFDQRTWTEVDRVVLDTAVQSLELALDRAAKTRRLDEERAALGAFTSFAEVVGSETDVRALVQQAITLLQDTCEVEAAHFERDGDLFKATVWSPLADPTVLPLLQQGLPLQDSGIARVLRQNTAAFIDYWNDTEPLIRESITYQAAAAYPYLVDGALDSVLMIGSKTTALWDERTKGIFRAVGRSLDLALDRARQTRTVTAQRDALNAHTQELAAQKQQLEASTLELEASNRDLQAFSYSVSHDLRTPVRHMIGFLHLARKELGGQINERAARYLDVIGQAGEQMNTLIDAMLDLSRAAQQTLQPQLVDLNGIMARIQATLLPDLLSRTVKWEVAVLPAVLGDRDALSQVLTQLTENALKFTRGRDPAVIRVWAEDQGEAWGVFVQDNGLGFDPRYQDRLFNMFQRLHSAQEASGTGVGLASVRRLILNHGGQVFAEGQVGQGATFGFTLPKMLSAQVRAASPLDTVMEKLAYAEKQASTGEAQQRFFLTLSDALRPLGDPVEIQLAASRLLGEQLACDRASYVELNEAAGEFVAREWHRSGAPSHVRRSPLSAWQMPGLMDGNTWVLRDVEQGQALAADQRRAYREDDIGAAIVVPFLRAGRLVAIVVVNQGRPRDWTPQEISTMEEAAQRTWAAVERAHTEEALRESELRRELAIDAAGLGTYVWYVQEDRPETDVRLLELLGVEGAGEVSLANALVNVIHPDDRERYAAEATRALDPDGDGKLAIEARFVQPGGAVKWIALTGQTVFEGAPRQAVRMYGTVADITERKRREANLTFLAEVSEDLAHLTDVNETLKTLCQKIGLHFSASISAFSEVDEATGVVTPLQSWQRDDIADPTGDFRLDDYHSGEVQRLIRFGQPEIMSDTTAFPEVVATKSAALKIGAYVNTPLARDGAWRFTLSVTDSHARDWRGDELELMRELTTRTWTRIERARAEEALKVSEERFSSVANLVPDLLWDSEPDGFTPWYNRRWLEYTGQSFEQATGWGWTDAIHPDDREESARHYREAVLAGQALRQEHRIRRHDGEYRWFVVNTVPLKNERGRIIKMYGAATDIHDLRIKNTALEARVAHRTRQLTETAEQLEQRNKELDARTRALEAFSQLTRHLTLETDRYALVQRVQETLLTLLPPAHTGYFELETDLWRMKSEAGDLRSDTLRDVLNAGLPPESPGPFVPFSTGRPEYQDAHVPGQDTPAETSRHIRTTAGLPIMLGGVPVGVLSVGRFDAQPWQPVDKIVLETAAQALSLALERAEAVRALEEEREALSAFARFTERASEIQEPLALAQYATEVLFQVLNVDNAAYFEREGEVWNFRRASGTLDPDLTDALSRSVSAGLTGFRLPAERREPMFFEHWNSEQWAEQRITGERPPEAPGPPTARYTAIAAYPLFPQDHPAGMLNVGVSDRSAWTDREKAIFRAVGDSFRLALERTAQLQQIQRQRERLTDLNAELGNFITRTAYNLEEPARQLDQLLGAERSSETLPSYDPAALVDEVARLRSVARDLRQLSELEGQALHTELLPLGELFAEVSTTPPGNQVTWHLKALPIVRGDRALMRQALEVLLTFTLSETRGTRYVTVSSRTVQGEVQVTVKDDGIGLSGEEAATLFDVAVRTDQALPVLEGSSLVQVRRILARHGGWVWAEAQHSSGKVVLAFPRDETVSDLEALFRQDKPGT